MKRPPRLLAVALLATLILAAAASADRDAPDPLPLRRVVLPAARIPDALKQARDGELVQMPRADFDALVRKAASAARDGREPPRLIEARYRATLTDAPSLSGSAQWKILNPSGRAALLRLQSLSPNESQTFNLAVSKPRFDNRDALLGEFPDGAARVLALLIDEKGRHTLTFDWSARVEARPEGLQVDLRLPESPAAVLELNLPADRSAASADGTLVSGPHPAEANDRRLWRIACGGKSSVQLLLRRAGEGKPLLLAKQKTVQKLTPDAIESATTFSVEALHQDVQELFVEADATLSITEVSAPNLARWEAKSGGVLARLDRPAREVTLTVRGVAPLSSDVGKAGYRLWASPAVRLRDAIPRGEALDVWVHPQLRLASWDAGDFRLTNVQHLRDASKVEMRRLSLTGGGLAPAQQGKPPRRPSALIQAGAVEFRVSQSSLWRLGDEGMELTSRIDYQVRQGLLFQLPLRLPAGWEVESVAVTPAEGLRSYGERDDKAGRLLIVDLRRPLREGSLTVRLRPRQALSLTGRDLPFPDVVPLGARARQGGLAIDYDDQSLRAAVKTASPSIEPPADALWDKLMPEYFYPFEGQSLSGTLRLSPRPPRARSRASTDVQLSAGRASLTTRLHVQAESGRTSYLDVYLGDLADGWEWRADQPGHRVRWAERLVPLEAASAFAGLGVGHPLGAVAFHGARPGGAYWRIHLDRPLPPGAKVTLSASRLLDGAGPLWAVPLPVVLGAGPFDGEVTIRLAGHATLRAAGLRDDAAPRGAWRRLRYDALSARLAVRSSADVAPAAGAAAEAVRLTSTLSGHELTHLFRFRLTGWAQRTVPVTLPEGARLTGAAVDGRWIERLPTEGTIELPVPSRSPHYELLYVTKASRGTLGARLDAPAPDLPVAPANLERRWRLPADVAPLWSGGMRQLPGDGPELNARPWQRIESLFRLGPRLPLPAERSPRPQALADALDALAVRHADSTLTLGEATAELSSNYLKDAHPLFIDHVALRRADVERTSALHFHADADGPAAWNAVGLELLPVRAGVVLTTRAQGQRWRRASTQGEWPLGLEAALDEALRRGRDDDGRFVSVVEWQAASAAPVVGLLGPASAREDHARWSPLDGTSDEPTLTVVRLPVVATVGLLLAALLAAGAFVLRRGWHGGHLIAWPAAAGLALAWLPGSLADVAWWPLLAGVVAAVVGLLRWASRPRAVVPKAATTAKVGAALAGAVFVVLMLTSSPLAQGQKTLPDAVFIIPGAKQGEQNVLVAPALVKKLNVLAAGSLAPSSGAVLLDAAYEGKQAKAQAAFDATLSAHCLDDTPSTLDVPFDGQLTGDVLVDGAKAFPVALGGARPGFALKLKGKGTHKIRFAFVAAVEGEADAGVRLVRFGVPRLPQSRLTFRTEAGASYLQVPMRHGGQKVSADGKGQRLDADLGALGVPVVLRWQQEGKQPRQPRVTFREAYVWDLAADVATLAAFVAYDVADGATTSLRLDLPEGLEPRLASARRPTSAPADASVRLSEWSVSGRTLRLDFPGPVSGPVEVTLELVPRGPWQGTAALLLPHPQGRATQSHLAYRVNGVEMTKLGASRVLAVRTEQFAPFWPARPATLNYAGTFPRDGEAPSLRLDLRPRLPRVEVAQDVTLRVGPRQAAWAATADVTTIDGDASVLQWHVQSLKPLTVTDVKGKGDVVRAWSQDGPRVIVWLNRSATRTTLDFVGWLPLDVPVNKGAVPRLDLPCLRLSGVSSARTRLTLWTEPGLTLQAAGPLVRLNRLGLAGSRPLVYASNDVDHRGAFFVRPGASAVATIRTEAGLRSREVTFASTIELQAPGEQRSFVVRVRDWPGDVSLDAPGIAVGRATYRRVGGRREWTWAVELPKGETKPVRLSVRGQTRPDESGDGVTLPDVSLPGVRGERTLAIDDTLVARPAEGLVALPDGKSWRIADGGWSLRVAPRERAAAARAVLAEHRVRLEDGRHWTHESSWLVWQDGASPLTLSWPGRVGGVKLLSAAVDDNPLSQAHVERNALTLPPAGRAGPRRVTVRWRYLDRDVSGPTLLSPTLAGVAPGPATWVVEVPPGWEETSAEKFAGASARAAIELHRAEARLELARSLVAEGVGGEALANELGRAGRSLRLAGLAINAGAAGRAPAGGGLSEWRARLAVRNAELLRETRVEPATVRDDAPAGVLVSWVRAKDDAVPRVQMLSASRRQTEAALTFSGQWLVLALVVAVVAALPWLRAAARRLWPETLLLLGVAGYVAAGPTVAVVFVVALGAAGRAVLLGQGVAWLVGRAEKRGRG